MTREERMQKVARVRDYYQSYFNSIGEPDAYFTLKALYTPKGKTEPVFSLYPSELSKGSTVYVQPVDFNMELLNGENVLYKLPYNKFFRDEYEVKEHPQFESYLVPLSEFIPVDFHKTPSQSYEIKQESINLTELKESLIELNQSINKLINKL